MEKKLELRLILDAVDKLTRPLRAANREAAAANQVLQQTKAKVKELEAAQRDIASFKGMTTQLAQTSGALQAAKIKADELARAHAAAENPTKKMTAALSRAEKQVERLQAEEASRTAQLDQMRSKLDAAGISTKNLTAHEARLKAEIADGNLQLALQKDRVHQLAQAEARLKAARTQYDKTQAFAGSMQGAGMSAIGAGMVAAAPLVASGGLAVNFEDAMLDVKKVVDFETPQQFAQMSDDILTLTTRIPIAAEGFASIVAAAGQAKIPRAELMGFAEDAGKMGVAFDSTAEEAGKMMATWRTAFALTQPQVRGLADQINYLGDNGNATALQISNVVTRVGPLGKVAGLAAAQVAALGSTMVGMGVGEEIAATGIKNTMLALTKGEAATKSQKQAFAALGLEATAVAKAMQTDAGGAIMDVMRKIQGLDAHRQAAILTQLFGSESVSAIAPMLTNLDVLQENLNAVGDASLYAGSMDKEFQNRMSGTKTAIDTAKNSVKALGVEFGSAFLPQIKAVSDTVNTISTGFRDFAKARPAVVGAIGTVVGIVAAALLAFGALAMIIAAVLGPFALMRMAMIMTTPLFKPLIAGVAGAARAFAAWGVAMLANPITWIVLGIVAAVALVAGAAYLIYKNWGAISSFFTDLWSKVSAGVSNFLTIAAQAFMRFSPAGWLLRAFAAVWPVLSSIGARFVSFGGEILQGLVNGIKGGIPAIVRAIVGAGAAMVTGFKNRLGIRSPSRVFAGFGDDTMAGLTRGLDRSSASPVAAISRTAAAMAAAGSVTASAGLAFAEPPSFDAAPRFIPGAGSAGPGGGARGSSRPAPTVHNEFHIHAAPGMDLEALARLVAEKMAEAQRQTNLAALDDTDESWS
ncbi:MULTISPECIES: phage tail tape measure protein [Brevundimonas]|uniref:phage tail tape measure protein n=1 Tax=Brevundimonas sp. UBA7507 TaxID=1946137 RepID=UPI0025798036|nr:MULTISPECIES: phage tail tape measure protein [Brevundimonas]